MKLSVLSFPVLTFLLLSYLTLSAQNTNQNKFRQMKQELATPNMYRSASGAPGSAYYQQKVDYVIKVKLDDEKQSISGEEKIIYHNNAPEPLSYLWVQLDQNMRAKDSDSKKINQNKLSDKTLFQTLKSLDSDFDGGFKLEYVKDAAGNELHYYINKTMMRVDLPKPLTSGGTFTFQIKWWYNINDRMKIGGRSGYEYFEEDGNYLYTIAQFFPRLAVYNDVEGWQNNQFYGRSEFALPFGDYDVEITVPTDHIVAATGQLQNAKEVLTKDQLNRFNQAKQSDEPVLIVSEAEAIENEKSKLDKSKTWHFKANFVRDFAFASSRKFIWDAMVVKIGEKRPLAMSFYPKEGNPLWGQYSTKVVAHTLRSYSKHTIDYPYPVAISVHTKWIGMEYPMICFNGGRPEPDGTYSERTKYGMIGVIIHEVGHNFFPMIINSDERQWTWMDEGLNTFVQTMAQSEWDVNYPVRRGMPSKIVDYMKSAKSDLTPIMTNSESLKQFGNNAYAKPATALTILRETILGRELFDYAFKEYARRWAFKHPTPTDLFRTMEDASATDLDWFWRAWFFTTDNVDISIDNMKWYKINKKDPESEKESQMKEKEEERKYIGYQRNLGFKDETAIAKDSSLLDFYNNYDPYEVTEKDEKQYQRYMSQLSDEQKSLMEKEGNYYELTFTNKGGIPMPIILEFELSDGTKMIERIPAEIWRFDDTTITKVFYFEKEVDNVTLDPLYETADVDRNNNYWPPKKEPSRMELFKQNYRGRYGRKQKNPMQLQQEKQGGSDEK
jgi:peptidase M1-like protein